MGLENKDTTFKANNFIDKTTGITKKTTLESYFYSFQALLKKYYLFAEESLLKNHSDHENINELRGQWENVPIISNDSKFRVFVSHVDSICKKLSSSGLQANSKKDSAQSCSLEQLKAMIDELKSYKENHKNESLICETYILYLLLHFRTGWRVVVGIYTNTYIYIYIYIFFFTTTK